MIVPDDDGFASNIPLPDVISNGPVNDTVSTKGTTMPSDPVPLLDVLSDVSCFDVTLDRVATSPQPSVIVVGSERDSISECASFERTVTTSLPLPDHDFDD